MGAHASLDHDRKSAKVAAIRAAGGFVARPYDKMRDNRVARGGLDLAAAAVDVDFHARDE